MYNTYVKEMSENIYWHVRICHFYDNKINRKIGEINDYFEFMHDRTFKTKYDQLQIKSCWNDIK